MTLGRPLSESPVWEDGAFLEVCTPASFSQRHKGRCFVGVGRTLWTAGHALDGFWVQTIASQSVARQTSLPGNKIAPQQIRL